MVANAKHKTIRLHGRKIPQEISTHQIGGNHKTLSTIDGRGSKLDRNGVFDCHLMTIKNTVSIDFLSTFIDSDGVFDCRLSGVINEFLKSETHFLYPRWPLSTRVLLNTSPFSR